MKKTVFCKFLKHNAEGMDFKIYPGKLGDKIYNNISKKAWLEWLSKQTIIINEKKLNMLKIKDRKYLEKKMIDFLFKKT